jgi:L-ascorbate metabolism protein UlaG (beta-lactamase superfamily)
MEGMKKVKKNKQKLIAGILIGFLFLNVVGYSQEQGSNQSGKEGNIMLENVHWLGHAAFRVDGSKTVYVDPFQIKDRKTADLILITHEHYDHLSKDDIKKIQGDETIVVLPVSASGKLKGNVKTVNPGDTLTVGGIGLIVVPAYNIGKRFHPKDAGHVGYVFTLDGVTYYHAGDTDRIPEMKQIRADVAFLPVGGTYTMNANEAAEAVKDIQPKAAVPMHWGSIIGSKSDAESFQKICDCEVVILNKE